MLAASLTRRQHAVDSRASATTILSCGDWALCPIVSKTSKEPHLCDLPWPAILSLPHTSLHAFLGTKGAHRSSSSRRRCTSLWVHCEKPSSNSSGGHESCLVPLSTPEEQLHHRCRRWHFHSQCLLPQSTQSPGGGRFVLQRFPHADKTYSIPSTWQNRNLPR